MQGELRVSPVLRCVTRNESGRIELRWPNGDCNEVGGHEALRAGRKLLDGALATFQQDVRGVVPEEPAVERALEKLLEATDHLVRVLLGDDIGLRVEIEQRLLELSPSLRGGLDTVGFVEVTGRDDFFPFEILPLFPPPRNSSIGRRGDAEDLLARFLGYRFAIRRLYSSRVIDTPLQRNRDGTVPIQFLRYRMTGAVTEQQYLGTCVDRLRVDGPWPPDDLAEGEVVTALLDVLHNPTRQLDGEPPDVPCQIQHFACHCDTRWDQSDKYQLILGTGSGRKISLKQMYDGVLDRERDAAWRAARPLVFLNACGAARVAADFRSFPRWFLDNRFRAFVGAETEIPDPVAADYAARMYDELLNGRTLAEAVVRARRRLYEDRGNPLGLLYVMYGDPTLRLTTEDEP
jgi:hypothetical protein